MQTLCQAPHQRIAGCAHRSSPQQLLCPRRLQHSPAACKAQRLPLAAALCFTLHAPECSLSSPSSSCGTWHTQYHSPPPCGSTAVHKTGAARRRPAVRAAAVSFEGPIPEGVQLELKSPEEGEGVDWDADRLTLRLPVSVVEGAGVRRSKLVVFTCNKCGGRTARNVNPVAWEKGLVMCQCATPDCQVWHMLSAENKAIYEEIRYSEQSDADSDSGLESGSEASVSVQSSSSHSSNNDDSSIAGEGSSVGSLPSDAAAAGPAASGSGDRVSSVTYKVGLQQHEGQAL